MEGDYVEEEEYGEITPLPQRPRKRRERRRWENEIESGEENMEKEITRRKKGTLMEQMKEELLKKRNKEMEEEKRRLDQKRRKIMGEMKAEERRSMDKIKKKYEKKIRDMEDILK